MTTKSDFKRIGEIPLVDDNNDEYETSFTQNNESDSDNTSTDECISQYHYFDFILFHCGFLKIKKVRKSCVML